MEPKEKKQISKLQNRLLEFCNSYDNIYLYGAGKVADSYLKLLKKMGKIPKGVIVSKGEAFDFHGLPIYNAAQARGLVNSQCGIVAAFMGANGETIQNLLGKELPVFCLSDDVLCALIDSLEVVPFLDNLSKGKGGGVVHKGNWHRILVIRLDVLGDLIMTTAFIRELRSNCPDAEITLVVLKQNYHLFKECPYISNLLLYDGPVGRGHLDAQFSRLSDIEQRVLSFKEHYWQGKQDYDIAFLPCTLLQGVNSLETFILALSSPAKSLVGRVNSFRMDERALYPYLDKIISLISYEVEEKHEVQYILDMLLKTGCVVHDESTELWADEEAGCYAHNIIPKKKDTPTCHIALGLVGSTPSKNWPIEKFKDFALKLTAIKANNMDVKFVLFGGPEAIGEAADFVKYLPEIYKNNVIDMTGKTTLLQAIALMKQCNLYVGADTGIMHMAAACGLPVVELSIALPGSTIADGAVPKRMGPWKVRNIVLQPKSGLDGCQKLCKQNKSHCIKQIGVDEVVEATIKLVGQ